MSHFEIDCRVVSLPLAHPFAISRGSRSAAENVFIRIRRDGITGFGEAAPNARYGENPAQVVHFVENLSVDLLDGVEQEYELSERLERMTPCVQSAWAAIEMAWLDWWGKYRGQSLWDRWEAPSRTGPVTSFTIGLDEMDVMQNKVREAEEYPVLKVKLGTERDREIIEGIRALTGKPIRVDVNEGWSTLVEAKEGIRFLAGQNVEMVEQPMPAQCREDLVKLKEWSPLPLCADESFEGDEDLDELARSFDIVNIKLMKIGSLRKVREMIGRIREKNLEVMIGCMIESSLANTAGALLSLWTDYADLDGHLLISEDPFHGLELDDNKRVVVPTEEPGLGVKQVREIW